MTSYALMQTAHTEPALRMRVKAGLASVFNAIDQAKGRDVLTNTTPEPAVRLGVTDFMDVGLAPWLGTGARVDGKTNLLNNRLRAAFAPRLSAGYALGSERRVFGLEVGAIGSYRAFEWLEPYAGLSFENQWFTGGNRGAPAQLARNQRFAVRRGYGDGLVKLALGVDLEIESGWHALFEYDHWLPAQNDPGDGYALFTNDIVALSLAYYASGG